MNGKVNHLKVELLTNTDLFTNICRKNAGKITDQMNQTLINQMFQRIDPNAKSLVIKKVVSGAADANQKISLSNTFTKHLQKLHNQSAGKIGETSKTYLSMVKNDYNTTSSIFGV